MSNGSSLPALGVTKVGNMSYPYISAAPSPSRGVYQLWHRSYTLSILVSVAAAVTTGCITFLHMYGLMTVLGWAAFALLGVALGGVVLSMYLMGVVTDDFSVIRPFRAEALSLLWAPAVVFVCSGISLTISTFVR